MKLAELCDLILSACQNGYAEAEVGVITEDDSVDCGISVKGLRLVTDNINSKEIKYADIIENWINRK